MSSHTIEVTDSDFEERVLRSSLPVLVDFWAEWCGPCKSVAPIVEAVAEAYAGRLTVAKMDVDANQATPARYGVQGIPTLMLFKGGEREAAQVGALDKSQLIAFIDQNL